MKKHNERESLSVSTTGVSKELKNREENKSKSREYEKEKERNRDKSWDRGHKKSYPRSERDRDKSMCDTRSHEKSPARSISQNKNPTHELNKTFTKKSSPHKNNTLMKDDTKDVVFNFKVDNFNCIVRDSSMPGGNNNNSNCNSNRNHSHYHNINNNTPNQLDIKIHTYTLPDFVDKIISDFREVSDEHSHIDMLNFISCVDSSVHVGKSFLQQYLKFRDMVMKSDRNVLAEVLFYYIWLHKNIIDSAKKANTFLKILIEEKETNKASEKVYSKMSSSVCNNPHYQKNTSVNAVSDKGKDFLNKKRQKEALNNSSVISRKQHREEDQNENASTNPSTSVKCLPKKNIQAMIDNDEKYNMLKKILPTIKSKESLEICGLKSLISREKYEAIDAVMSGKSKRNLEIEVYSTDYYRMILSLDLKGNRIQIRQSMKNSISS